MKRWLILLFLFGTLFASEEELFDVELSQVKEPHDKQNSFLTSTDYRITPKVNPITGEYCEDEVDFVLAGSQPLSVRRFYNSGSPYDRRYASWRYNPETCFVANLEWRVQELFGSVGEADGTIHCLKPDPKKEMSFKFEMTNKFHFSPADGKSHPLNTKFSYWRKEDAKDYKCFEFHGTIVDGSGRERVFASPKHRWRNYAKWQERSKWLEPPWIFMPDTWTPFPIPIVEEKLPNGNIICYEYTQWKKETQNFPLPRLLSKITAYNRDKSKVLGSIELQHPRQKYKDVTAIYIIGSDGRRSMVGHVGTSPINLNRAEAPWKPKTTYEYDYRSLTKVAKPLGTILRTKYQKDGKVAAQYAPVGPKGRFRPIARYHYEDRRTIVTDAENNQTIYNFDEHQKILSIENECYIQRFNWCKKTGNLIRKILKDKKTCTRLITKYQYDNNQNPILEQIGDGKEWRTIKRTYSEDGFNLKLSESDRDGKTICYSYVPGTNLPQSELTYDQDSIRQRVFHTYDDCAICVRTIADDGVTENPDDLTGVTYRKITDITPKSTMPCFGLPEVVEEKTIDSSGAEILLGKVVYTYTSFGKVTQEDHYDLEGKCCYSIYNEYDENERLVSTTDPVGSTTSFAYDANFNLISITGPKTGQYKEIEYDKANRPVKFHDWQSDGSILIIEKLYDMLGRVIEEIDPCNQSTRFEYDSLDRVTATYYPDFGVARREYDVFGNVTKEIDPEGYVTTKTFNAFNQPLSICHPDGSKEHFTYNPTGTIRSHIDINGATTLYTYDIFDHPTCVEIYSSEGKLLKKTTALWSPFHKLSETEEDLTTNYRYDFAGRKIEESIAYTITTYTYDALGRVSCAKNQESCTFQEYDADGREIYRRTEADGVLQTEERYAYDEMGNRTHVFNSQGVTETHFNTHGKPLSIKDPLGFTTHFAYDYGDLLTQTITHPNGVQEISISNTMGKEAMRLKKNAQGETIQRSTSFYDKNGNQIRQAQTIFSGTKPVETITHTWEYGPTGRMERFVEAGERETRYLYDSSGRLQTIIKPNGTQLNHAYDELGRLSRYYGHDFDYHYTYDARDRVLSVYDTHSGTTTTRTYDPLDNVLSETLANGLTLTNAYDSCGRRIQCTLPDTSTITYTYQGDFLHTVSRNGLTHTYSQRNLEGLITEAHSPAGAIQIVRDPLGRYSALLAPHFQAVAYSYDSVGNLASYFFSDDLGSQACQFSYDPLNQLLEENDHIYRFDSLNNRLEKDDNEYTVNTLCQVTHDGQTEYTYDLCGNLISDGLRTYTYDSLDRLISVEEGNQTTRYTYDPFHRRLTKNQIRFLWDEDNEIGTFSNKIDQLRILGEGLGAEIGAAVFLELSGHTHIPIHDHRGCLVVLIDLNSDAETYRYTAFGEELTDSTRSPWRFSSKRFDEETGLIFFGRRYYNSNLGRWITQDPEGFHDGPNLYAYVHNSPLTLVDLYGLEAYLQSRYSEFARDPTRIPSYPLLFSPSVPPEFGLTFESGMLNKSSVFDLKKDFGLPDLPNGGGIFFVNGMRNTLPEVKDHAKYLSDLSGGYNITATHNATHGSPMDLLESGFGLFRGQSTDPVNYIHQMWNAYFENAPPEMLALHFCTSQGAIHTKQALKEYPQELRERIRVVGIAPAAYISRDLCHSVRHYAAEDWRRDFVPRIDLVGRIKNHDTITYVPSHPDAPRFDHSFASPTYSSYIRDEIYWYFKLTQK